MSNGYATPSARRPMVVKYGGNAMAGGDPLLADLATLNTPVVLVHGGGPEIDRWLSDRSITTERIDGNRVTNATTLEITEAVLCGTINKRLVRECAALGMRAIGISGQDAGLLVARPVAHRALGFVGEITHCDPTIVLALLSAGMLPIIAPLAISEDRTTALNVNADLAAAAIAGALKASAFLMVTNVARVLRDLNDPSSAIDRLTLNEATTFVNSAACDGGMKPKMKAAIDAVSAGATASYICDAQPIFKTLAGAATVVA